MRRTRLLLLLLVGVATAGLLLLFGQPKAPHDPADAGPEAKPSQAHPTLMGAPASAHTQRSSSEDVTFDADPDATESEDPLAGPPPSCRIIVTLRGGDVPGTNYTAVLRAYHYVDSEEIEAGATVTFAVDPGSYTVVLRSPVKVLASWGSQTDDLAEQRVSVVESEPEVHVELTLPSHGIVAHVVDASSGRPIEGAQVWVNAVGSRPPKSRVRISKRRRVQPFRNVCAKTDREGVCIAAPLDGAVDYEVSIAADGYLSLRQRPAPPWRDVTVRQATYRLEPAGYVRIELLGSDGAPQEISAAIRPSLRRRGVGEHARIRIDPPRSRPRPKALRTKPLTPGAYVLDLSDELGELDGEPTIRFQPIQFPAELVRVQVRAGKEELVSVPAPYRTYAQLRAGAVREAPHAAKASLRVYLPAKGTAPRRLVLPASWQGTRRRHRSWHFEGYLAKGRYDIEVHGSSGRILRDVLIVQGDKLQRTFDTP